MKFSKTKKKDIKTKVTNLLLLIALGMLIYTNLPIINKIAKNKITTVSHLIVNNATNHSSIS